MARYPTVCCEMCGRDTPNKSRICKVCNAGIRKHTAGPVDSISVELDDYRALFCLIGDNTYEYDRDDAVRNDVRAALQGMMG